VEVIVVVGFNVVDAAVVVNVVEGFKAVGKVIKVVEVDVVGFNVVVDVRVFVLLVVDSALKLWSSLKAK
jgi:hypothetical protein